MFKYSPETALWLLYSLLPLYLVVYATMLNKRHREPVLVSEEVWGMKFEEIELMV